MTVLAAAFALGLFTIAAQTALLREYLVLLRGSELAIGAFFSAWFAWIAVSAAASARLPRLAAWAAARAGTLLAVQPLAAAAAFLVPAGVRQVFGVPPYEPAPPGVLVAGAMAAAFPVSGLTGMLFPAVCARAGANAGYVAETAGAVAGGAVATAAALAGGGGLLATALAGLVQVVAAVPLARTERGGRVVAVVAAATLLVLVVPGPGTALRDSFSDLRLASSLAGAARIAEAETPYQVVTTARTAGQTVVLADGAVEASYPPGPDVAGRAALLACQPRGHARAAVIGQGRLDLAAALSRYYGDTVVVAADEVAVRAHREAWTESGGGEEVRAVGVAIADPRAWMRLSRDLDLVVLGVAEPSTLATGRLYTEEAFREAAAALAPGGVLAAFAPSAENYVGTELLRYGQSLYATLSHVFPDVQVIPGEPALLLASTAPGQTTVDPAVLEARFRAVAPRPPPYPADGLAALVRPERAEFVRGLYAKAAPGDLVNRDDRPLAPFLHLLASLRQSGTGGTRLLWGVREAGAGLVAALLALGAVFAVRGRARSGRAYIASFVVAVAGATSIASSVAVLAAYQSAVGALYGEVGAATALSMAGLALGAVAGRRFAGRAPAPLAWPAVAAVAMAVAPFAVDTAGGLGPVGARLAFGGLFLGLGILSGAAWPIAGALLPVERRAALLESADHQGAAAAAAVAGVLVLAIHGGKGALLALAGLNVVTMAVAVADRLLRGRRASGRGGALAFAAIAAVVVAAFARLPDPRLSPVLSETDLRRFETFESARAAHGPPPHHILEGVGPAPGGGAARSRDGRALAAATRAAAPEVSGWGGPMNLFLSVGTDGLVRNVGVIGHSETPAYVRDLPAYLERFRGADVRAACALPPGVDAMTGATVTRDAVSASIAATCRALASGPLGVPVAEAGRPPWWKPLADARVAWVVLLLTGTVLVHFFASGRFRLVFLVVAAVAGGVVFNVSLSAQWLLDLAGLRMPSFDANAPMWLLSVGVIGTSLALGPIFCAHACPFGATQELLSRLGSRWIPPAAAPARLRAVKFVVLAVLAFALLAGTPPGAVAWDPLPAAFSMDFAAAAWPVAVLALAGAVVAFRPWCRVFCPVGAFLGLFNRVVAVIGIAPRRSYAACDLGATGPADRDCLQCNRCVRETSRTRRPPSRAARATLLAWAVATAVALVWVALASGGGAPAPGVSPGVRQVDRDLVDRLIQQGRLSDVEARFWVPAP